MLFGRGSFCAGIALRLLSPHALRFIFRIYYIGMLAQLLFVAGVIRLLVKHTRTFNDLWWNLISNVLQLAVRISMAMQSFSSRH